MQDIVDSRNCRMGKWHHDGSGKSDFGHTHAYLDLKSPHAAVNDCTKDVFSELEANPDNPDMQTIANALRQMEIASQKVFESLDRMMDASK